MYTVCPKALKKVKCCEMSKIHQTPKLLCDDCALAGAPHGRYGNMCIILSTAGCSYKMILSTLLCELRFLSRVTLPCSIHSLGPYAILTLSVFTFAGWGRKIFLKPGMSNDSFWKLKTRILDVWKSAFCLPYSWKFHTLFSRHIPWCFPNIESSKKLHGLLVSKYKLLTVLWYF